MEMKPSSTATSPGASSRLIHRLIARELTPQEVAEIGGGRAAAAAHAGGTVSCSAGCCDDCDMEAAM
jgi:hypothetical protein